MWRTLSGAVVSERERERERERESKLLYVCSYLCKFHLLIQFINTIIMKRNREREREKGPDGSKGVRKNKKGA